MNRNPKKTLPKTLTTCGEIDMINYKTPEALGFHNFKSWRPFQLEVIKRVLDSSKKFFMLDAPTGSGKSLIGMAICKILSNQNTLTPTEQNAGKSLYLCTTKDLQNQLQTDFPYIPLIKGRANYPCTYNEKLESLFPEFTADDCPANMERKDKDGAKSKFRCKSSCPYLVAKKQALKSPIAILNTAYFISEANYVGQFSGRKFVVVDEADELESQLLKFVDFKITRKAANYLGIGLPKYKTKFESWKQWAIDSYPVVCERIAYLEREFGDIMAKKDYEIRIYKRLKAMRNKLEIIVKYLDENWISNTSETSWEFKPIWVKDFTRNYIFSHAEKFLFMSSTILSPSNLAYALGIENSEWEYVSIPSQFPKENRKVYYMPVADITHKTEAEIAHILPVLTQIISNRSDKKGLIHTVSYKNAKFIMDNLRNDRLLFHDSSNRSQVLELFKSSKAPLIIVSPSMDRGIDFKYDLCSFIIIVKIPYLDLSDKQISTRVYSSKYGQLWYAWSTACSIIQMSGRATRAEDDFSETFILDKQFSKFYSQYHKFFPQWWKESLQYIDLEE